MVTVDIEEGTTIDVIGDVHGMSTRYHWLVLIPTFPGQFYDMLHLFSLTGEPSESHSLLMNGDLVDRGSWSMEVILTALAFKCKIIVSSSSPDH